MLQHLWQVRYIHLSRCLQKKFFAKKMHALKRLRSEVQLIECFYLFYTNLLLFCINAILRFVRNR